MVGDFSRFFAPGRPPPLTLTPRPAAVTEQVAVISYDRGQAHQAFSESG